MKVETAVFDLDYILYTAGFAAEKRTIEATHIPTGDIFNFANRTEFYGRGKKVGGWLADTNASRMNAGLPEFDLEEFEIVDIQSAEPLANVLHTVKHQVEKPMDELKAKNMVGYLGGKDAPLWRWERSTLLEYKGNRKEALSPIYKQDIIDFLVKKYKALVINDGFEADDRVVMKAYESPEKNVIIGVDKDSLGSPVKTYNPNKPELGITDGACFGEIWWDDKKKECRGYGRKFFYFQVINGDSVDNYKSNCFSKIVWGKKSAYLVLRDAETDVECFEIIKQTFQHLYPEKIVVQGWRGDEFEINWLYVASEMWDMARMWRHEKDHVILPDVLKKFKII